MAREQYMRQVELLVRTLPFIARQDVFRRIAASRRASAGREVIDDDLLALDILQPGLAHRQLAREGAHVFAIRRSSLRSEFVLACRGLEVLELKLHLLDQVPEGVLDARFEGFAAKRTASANSASVLTGCRV